MKNTVSLLDSIDRDDAFGAQQHYFELDSTFHKYDYVHRKWFEERNKIMATKLVALSKQQRAPIFAVIGAAHIGGDKGVVAMLKKEGFQNKNLNTKINRKE